MKTLSCPHCLARLRPDGSDCRHDQDLNLLCPHCGRVVFGTTEEADETVARLYRKPTHTYSYPHQNLNGFSAGIPGVGREYGSE